MQAFNAALVIFGSLLVASREREANPSAWVVIDESRPYIDKANEALHRLDNGNCVMRRCIEYLSQLSLVLNALGMSNHLIFYCLSMLFWREIANPKLDKSETNWYRKTNQFSLKIWISLILTTPVCRICFRATQANSLILNPPANFLLWI